MIFRPIRPGDPRARAAVEALFTDLQSYAPGSEHFLPESIDRSSVADQPVWQRLARIGISTRPAATLAAAGAATQLVHNGTALRLTLDAPLGAPLIVQSWQALRLRAHLVFSSSTAAAGLGVDGALGVEWWRDTGPAKLAGSAQWAHRSAGFDTAHALLFVEAFIPGPTTISWAELRYQYTPTGVANLHLHRSLVWANRHNLYEAG